MTTVARLALSAAALGGAACLGAYLRPCPACEVQERGAEKQSTAAASSSSAAASVMAEQAPRVIIKRVPVLIPQPAGAPPSCPQVAMAETIETSADSRITQAAVQQAASTLKQEATREHEAVTRTAIESGLVVGLMAGLRPENLGNWSDLAGQLSISKRIVGPIGAGAAVSWGPSEPLRLWGGVNYGF